MRRLSSVVLCFLLIPCTVAAQKPPVSASSPGLSLTAVGRQHHPIRTSSSEAQAYFDQGMTLVYGFNHEEAVRSFQRAAEIDPSSPMPLWGIALAVGPNYNLDVDAEREKLAYDTIQKALKLAEHAPQIEKDYVSALAARYSGDPNPDYKKLSRDYADAMAALSRKYPDDLDADAVRGKLDESQSLEAVDSGWPARRTHGGDSPGPGVGFGPRPAACRRKPLLHSRRRSLAESLARSPQRQASGNSCSRGRPSGSHARPYLRPHRRLCRRSHKQRRGGKDGQPLRREGRAARQPV